MKNGDASELKGHSVDLEKSLQTYIEKNLETLLGITFLETEYSTGKTHGGRIDTIGIDENGFPVIIEYKRSINENVINQGLYYLDWLLDHKAEFELRVLKNLGSEYEDLIDWSNPRLLCIAGDFTKYDTHAVDQINRTIELIRYRQFENDLLLLELVNATSAQSFTPTIVDKNGRKINVYRTFSEDLERSDEILKNRYNSLIHYIESLGDDVQISITKYYAACKRIKNFSCITIGFQKKEIIVWVKLNPDEFEMEEGFLRDVRSIGHHGTGDLEILIKDDNDLEKAKYYIQQSYEGS